jgi:pimeloyl-ACP methyl ester carboxylesterase
MFPRSLRVELAWSIPDTAFFLRQLASFSRLIRFDKRGQGMSDRVSGASTLETRMDDVRAVMDAVGSERAALLGASEGGPMSILFAATYPERWALIVVGSYARVLWAPDYPWGNREEDYRSYIEQVGREWGTAEYSARLAQNLAPSADDEGKRALATLLRQSSSPGSAAAYARMNIEIDVRHVLSAIRVPTLALNRSGDSNAMVGGSRYLAEHIAGARHVELPGSDHSSPPVTPNRLSARSSGS